MTVVLRGATSESLFRCRRREVLSVFLLLLRQETRPLRPSKSRRLLDLNVHLAAWFFVVDNLTFLVS